MMELDLWTEDFLLAREWGLDMPAAQLDGQYGDLKLSSRQNVDTTSTSAPLQVGTMEEPLTGSEDVMGIEWMESSDLSSYLDALDTSNIHALPLEDSLLNFSPSLISEDDLIKPQAPVQAVTVLDELSHNGTGQMGFGSLIDSLVSLESPVSPEIKVEDDGAVSPFAQSPQSAVEVSPVIKFEELSPRPSEVMEEFFVTVASPGMLGLIDSDSILSPRSSDDSLSLVSSPDPSPSPDSGINSIIETSPELYKIITTSDKSRFSPYPCSKSTKTPKPPKGRRTRKPAEPVPEHIIMEHVNKKDRKKLQNKNAAIRYRMKKKEEANGIKTDEQVLEEKNMALKTKVEDLQREIKYMKNLMEDVCKAKGLL